MPYHNLTKIVKDLSRHNCQRAVVTALSRHVSAQPSLKNISNSFATESASEAKKSPHSKLLRVCSNRNTNLHFAAIEADMLRVDWSAMMGSLVDDWIKSNKWSGFVELESNIRAYVNNNLPFLVLKWRKNEFQVDDSSMKFFENSDRIRMNLFPYEQVISAAAKHAISGQVGKFDSKSSELDKRKDILLDACKMLDSMREFSMKHQANRYEWTAHHTSCSNCFRLVVSGWFLMWRRMHDVEQPVLAEATLSAEEMMYNYATKWISFCSQEKDVKETGETCRQLIGGITQSDKPLLMGIATGLSLSKNSTQKAHSIELRKSINYLFSHE